MSDVTAMRMAGQPADEPPQAGYVPGTCNIGAEEIARRRRAGHLGGIVALALFVLLVAVNAPPIVRLVLVGLTAAGAAAGYLQARFKFCAAFGWAGVLNFGRHGATQRVENADARARDRMKALQIAAGSGFVGLLVGVVAALIRV